MRIELDIPDELATGRILILSGINTVAFKNPHEDFWNVIDTPCSRCGECCLDSPPVKTLNDERACTHLIKENDGTYRCGAGAKMPYVCLKGIPEGYCDVTYRKVKA